MKVKTKTRPSARSLTVKANWDSLTVEDRQRKLRGLLSLTAEQRKSQAVKGGITRRGRPSLSKGIPRSEKDKKAIGIPVKRWWDSLAPEARAEQRNKMHAGQAGKEHFKVHPEVARQCGIDFWKDPEKAARLIGHKPNKAELRLDGLLQKHFPSQWKYVGNGKVWLGHRCPDFININGKKAIIELFGIHWHNALSSGERSQYFKQYGFETLVIWEEEMKQEVALVKKIKAFSRQ